MTETPIAYEAGKSKFIEYYKGATIRTYARPYRDKVFKNYIKIYYQGQYKVFSIDLFGFVPALNMAHEWLDKNLDNIKSAEKTRIENKVMSKPLSTSDKIDTMIAPLKKWDIEEAFDPKQNYTMALLGSTKSGKSTFLIHLIKKIKPDFDLTILFSNSCMNKIYDPIRNKKNVIIMDQFHDELVKDLYLLNKKIKNKLKFLLVLDDEIDNKMSKQVKKMFAIYRNSGITSIFSGQDYSFFAKSNRNNTNYLFLFKQNSAEAVKTIVDKFFYGGLDLFKTGSKSDKLERYAKFIQDNTRDHNMLVLDILNDYKIYTYKTPDVISNC